MIPESVRRGIEETLDARGGVSRRVTGAEPVGGGCISPTARLRTDAGESFFLKWGGQEALDALIAAEAEGLRKLDEAGAVRVPRIMAASDGPGTAWLLLEWLEPGPAEPESWRILGGQLAALHRTRADRYGADSDNFIGSLPQRNAWSADWPAFWRDLRLEPRLRQAIDQGLLGPGDRQRFDRLFGRLDEILAPAADDGPSLLHGDLWSGNVHVMAEGTPALIDPSVYHGHREVDLAMADLFGGFGAGFRRAYEEEWPLAPGYEPVRRSVYQLYYLLVHVNLFGAGYVSRTRSALARAGDA